MSFYTPYSSPALNRIYDMIFCDELSSFSVSDEMKENYPWSKLYKSRDAEGLLELYRDRQLETRIRLLASRILLRQGGTIPQKDLLGVVIEVGMEQGLDVLAAYQDGSARYINYSGSMIVWESRTNTSDQLIQNLFRVSAEVVRQIGPWEGNRPAPPTAGGARINFLVSDGLYFGQASLAQLTSDALAGTVMEAATRLMIYLTETSRASGSGT